MNEGQSSAGKYLLLQVPNFNLATSASQQMGSYLRLGAVEDPNIVASPSAPRSTGEDLAAQVTSFIDDTRKRDGCPDFVPEAERQAETAKLHTKGGWRDHSDGNRITTTRGDKVEVIQGNYRLVVMGRRNDVAGWDISGGHVEEESMTFDDTMGIEYTTEFYGGTWKVTENVRKGDVTTTYHGLVKDYYWGESIESTTGSESPTAEKPNPVMTDRTWAAKIASYTGSAALRVPEMVDETWATKISSKTYADSVSDETRASTLSSTTTAATVSDTTTAAIISSTTFGNVIDTTVGTSLSTIVGAETEIIVGNVAEVTIGAQESLTLGAIVDITIGLLLDVCIAGKVSVSMGPTIEVDMEEKFEIKPLANETGGDELKFFGIKTGISGTHTDNAGLHILG